MDNQVALSMVSVFLTYVLAQLALRHKYNAAEREVPLPFYLRPASHLCGMVLPAALGFVAFIIGCGFAVAAFSP